MTLCVGVWGGGVGFGVPATLRVYSYLPSGFDSVISKPFTEIHESAHTGCLWSRKVNMDLGNLGFPLLLAIQSSGEMDVEQCSL